MGGSLKGPGGNPWWGRLHGKVRQESGGLALHQVQGGVGIGYPGVTSGTQIMGRGHGWPGTCPTSGKASPPVLQAA